MNILVTGSKGMVGTTLCNNLKNIRDNKNRTRSNLHIDEIYEYDLDSAIDQMDEYCQKSDLPAWKGDRGKDSRLPFPKSDGLDAVPTENGRYCYIPVTHKVTLGEIVDLLQQFKAQSDTLLMPKMPDGSFAKKLYSLYLTYLPAEKFKYALKMNEDNRGSFTELVHTEDCGQVSINISKPGITKG